VTPAVFSPGRGQVRGAFPGTVAATVYAVIRAVRDGIAWQWPRRRIPSAWASRPRAS